jgi:hypothetical protein
MRNRSWIAAAVATAGVVLGAALYIDYIDALETGHADVDVAAPRTRAPDQCVGTQPVRSLPGSADDTPMYRVADYVDKLAARRYSAVYTGMSVDDETQTLDVWRIPSTRFDADLCGKAVKGVTVHLHGTDIDRKALDALYDRIADDMKRWDGTFEMREVGVDERGFVHVGVDDAKRAEPLIEEEFGPRYIKVEHVEQAYADVG